MQSHPHSRGKQNPNGRFQYPATYFIAIKLANWIFVLCCLFGQSQACPKHFYFKTIASLPYQCGYIIVTWAMDRDQIFPHSQWTCQLSGSKPDSSHLQEAGHNTLNILRLFAVWHYMAFTIAGNKPCPRYTGCPSLSCEVLSMDCAKHPDAQQEKRMQSWCEHQDPQHYKSHGY